jgi:hypothetical protein
MKPCFLFSLILLMTGAAASAQLQGPLVKVTGEPGTGMTARYHSSIKQYYLEGALIDSGRLGKVYQMPVDRMHCLVPDAAKTAGMPVKKLKIPEPMPNAYLNRRRF